MNNPKWTVCYNISTPGSQWIGTGWEFFDDNAAAEECYDRQNKIGNCATMRPYYESYDRQYLGAIHR